jgi:hypothetical protein
MVQPDQEKHNTYIDNIVYTVSTATYFDTYASHTGILTTRPPNKQLPRVKIINL